MARWLLQVLRVPIKPRSCDSSSCPPPAHWSDPSSAKSRNRIFQLCPTEPESRPRGKTGRQEVGVRLSRRPSKKRLWAGQMRAPRSRLIISKIIRLTGCSCQEAKSAKRCTPGEWRAPSRRSRGNWRTPRRKGTLTNTEVIRGLACAFTPSQLSPSPALAPRDRGNSVLKARRFHPLPLAPGAGQRQSAAPVPASTPSQRKDQRALRRPYGRFDLSEASDNRSASCLDIVWLSTCTPSRATSITEVTASWVNRALIWRSRCHCQPRSQQPALASGMLDGTPAT